MTGDGRPPDPTDDGSPDPEADAPVPEETSVPEDDTADPVTDHRADLADRLRGGDGLLVGLDFDGTLAPIHEDPDAPTITPECRRALEYLAGTPRATVAVVSGRALADVKPRVGISGVVYAGNHGLELESGGEREVHPEARRLRPALERTVERLRGRLADVPGCEIEDKGLTATVHYRRTPDEAVGDVRSTVREVARAEGDDLVLSSGKESVELRPAVEWDKGTAMRTLLDRQPGDPTPLFVGDDETDEDAFRAIQPEGVGIVVGSAEGSAADYRIPSQRAVAPLLSWLATDVLGRRPDPGEGLPDLGEERPDAGESGSRADGGHPGTSDAPGPGSRSDGNDRRE